MADTSVVSRVRTKAGRRRNNGNKTTRRATPAIWRILVELDKPKRTLSKRVLIANQTIKAAKIKTSFNIGMIGQSHCKRKYCTLSLKS